MILRLWHCVSRINKIYPACAGNSTTGELDSCRLPVQPRSRGELLDHPINFGGKKRFNPACAGNSSIDTNFRTGFTVQPRSRGELFKDKIFSIITVGSTPLARGTRARYFPNPTMAGGSTPLAQGTRINELNSLNNLRFNPARAGNSYGNHEQTY